MNLSTRQIICLMACCLITVACSDNLFNEGVAGNGNAIQLSGNIRQENVTRASDYGFVSGDRMGVFIVDYDNGSPGNLAASGNRASNVLYTYDGERGKWAAPTEIYWRDSRTPIDVYGYYPGVNYIDDPASYQFEVSWQQNVLPQEGEMSNYEASDLLWGKATNVQPTTNDIVIDYRHQLAGVFVTLAKGDGMTDTEWEKVDKTVLVDNTIRSCKFNLQTGEITVDGTPDRSIQMLPQSGNRYRAVVIPQTVDAGKSLISVTIDGKAYSHKLTEAMKYQGGKMHNFTITVNKSAATGDYVLSFSDDGISDWVNDEISHSFSQNQYVIINCPEPGKLKESITAAGYDYKEMQNLKVTGTLNHDDFWFMRDEMKGLKHLNVSGITVKNAWVDHNYEIDSPIYADDVIPGNAFYGNKTIRSIVLPTSIKRICGNAFREMQLINTTLVIPEGVTKIDDDALSYNDFNNVELVLPQSLDTLGWIRCNWKCEFNLSDNIKHIGGIEGCPNFYGTFHVPSQLKQWPEISGLGSNGSFVGEVEIPQGIKEISGLGVSFKKRIALTLPTGVKKISGLGNQYGSIVFNDDLEEIGYECFYDASIPFQISLPSQLRKIESRAFWNSGIKGELVIPENCLNIGDGAFALTDITKLTLPSKLEYIHDEAFISMRLLVELTIPKYVNYIGDYALSGCPALQTIVCLNPIPPTLGDNPFGPGGGYSYHEESSVFFDKCVLEVPEQSIELYRNADGWKQFKNITPHRELAFNVPSITCLEKGITRSGIVRSEGAWEISECPSWVTVSPSSSDNKKTEVTVTVNANSGATREGKIVFKLKNQDYTTYTDVKQVAAEVKEDLMITLQTATKGNKAIPIFLVGEGYNAEDIASGLYLNDMKEQMEHIFSIEPMKTYREYFTVSTAIACSPESGIDGLRKFQSDNWWESKNDLVLKYAQKYGVGIKGNEGNSTILVLRNSIRTGDNSSIIYDEEHRGLAISWMAKSNDVYPFDQKGFILRELVGIAFGKLGPEYVNHFTFIKACGCPECNMIGQFEHYRSLGWWQNVSISSKLSELPWYHLIFDEKYAKYVDAYEGAMNHSRGAYRSENASVMGNQFIPYFNAISREILVKRIMEASGGTFDFNTWKRNDKIEIPE